MDSFAATFPSACRALTSSKALQPRVEADGDKETWMGPWGHPRGTARAPWWVCHGGRRELAVATSLHCCDGARSSTTSPTGAGLVTGDGDED